MPVSLSRSPLFKQRACMQAAQSAFCFHLSLLTQSPTVFLISPPDYSCQRRGLAGVSGIMRLKVSGAIQRNAVIICICGAIVCVLLGDCLKSSGPDGSVGRPAPNGARAPVFKKWATPARCTTRTDTLMKATVPNECEAFLAFLTFHSHLLKFSDEFLEFSPRYWPFQYQGE